MEINNIVLTTDKMYSMVDGVQVPEMELTSNATYFLNKYPNATRIIFQVTEDQHLCCERMLLQDDNGTLEDGIINRTDFTSYMAGKYNSLKADIETLNTPE